MHIICIRRQEKIKMNKKSIYRKVAKEYGVSIHEVKQEMQAALEQTYKNTPNDGITGAWQRKVPSKGEIPTPDELLRYAQRDFFRQANGKG